MQLVDLYRQMARARAFEDALAVLWREGRISGELHLGTGEEAVAVAITRHLREGDGIALDHRPTPLLVMLGVDLAAMLKEMLGQEDGLNRGRGGHMHLLSRQHLAASSGIVGASGPLGAGFALSAKLMRKGSVGVAVFGDGAANQGSILETLNLAAVWSLPLVLVCKDNDWAVTTRSSSVTGGDLVRRAAAFGVHADQTEGVDAPPVVELVGKAVSRARRGGGATFLRVATPRLDGHLVGDPLVRVATHPIAEGRGALASVLAATLARHGGGLGARTAGLIEMMSQLRRARRQDRGTSNDPVEHARRALDSDAAAERVDREIAQELAAVFEVVLGSGR